MKCDVPNINGQTKYFLFPNDRNAPRNKPLPPLLQQMQTPQMLSICGVYPVRAGQSI